jgi:hypothetical protein
MPLADVSRPGIGRATYFGWKSKYVGTSVGPDAGFEAKNARFTQLRADYASSGSGDPDDNTSALNQTACPVLV